MKNINIVLFACMLLISQISCKEKDLTPQADPPADSTNVTLLAENGHSPAWSPDGKEIAYFYQLSIYLMNSDGSNKRCLTVIQN